MDKRRIRRPIQRDLAAGCIVFVILLCVVLSLQAYRVLTTSLTDRYESRFEETLLLLDDIIDAEDLQECIRTKEPSAEYEKL